MTTLPFIPLRDQIAALERIIEAREVAHRMLIEHEQMTAEQSDKDLIPLRAALATLHRCAALDEDSQP